MSNLPQSIRFEAFSPKLANCGHNQWTQYGEDGLLARIFDLIGTTNRWCFEVGAADGVFYSNTMRLREDGWDAVLIESSDELYEKLARFESPTVRTVHETATNLDDILFRCGAPLDLDLGVIDIDGQDYWLWHDMTLYQPRVLMIEFHWADGDTFIPARGAVGPNQAGWAAMNEIAFQKGYELAARTHVNLIYIRKDCTGWQ